MQAWAQNKRSVRFCVNTTPDLQMSSLNVYLLTWLQTIRTHHPTFVTPLFFHSPILLRRRIMSAIAPNIIINAAKDMVNLPQTRNDTFNRRWNSVFGASPKVCSVLWNKIDSFKTMPMGVHPKHMLWALCFLTVYDTEHNSSHRVGKVDKKTHRKWSELFVEQYRTLNVKW